MDTFVVRVHRSEDQAEANLRGIVEEISSGTKATFRTATELLSILTWGVAPKAGPHAPVAPPRPIWPLPRVEKQADGGGTE